MILRTHPVSVRVISGRLVSRERSRRAEQLPESQSRVADGRTIVERARRVCRPGATRDPSDDPIVHARKRVRGRPVETGARCPLAQPQVRTRAHTPPRSAAAAPRTARAALDLKRGALAPHGAAACSVKWQPAELTRNGGRRAPVRHALVGHAPIEQRQERGRRDHHERARGRPRPWLRARTRGSERWQRVPELDHARRRRTARAAIRTQSTRARLHGGVREARGGKREWRESASGGKARCGDQRARRARARRALARA